MPKYHIVTFGCQMNKNDSERIAGLLSGIGFSATDVESEADLILMNTCSVRQSAEERIFGKMKDYKELKEKNSKLIVAVTGCMAGRDHDGALKKRLQYVDLFFPTRDMVNLPRWIAELRPELANGNGAEVDYLKIRPLRLPSAQAYVTIQTGCNNFCTYCVVPYARGLESNRPVRDILQEAQEAVDGGVLEITLLGQAVNAYRAPDPESFSAENPFSDHFAALLWEINQIERLERLNWTAAYPSNMTDEVVAALGLPKQVRFLHLPVQSGSDVVLKRMNRKYQRRQYLDIIGKIKGRYPDFALGTDIIVGFCGETDEDFAETVDLYERCAFDISYTAQYSERSGTLAVKLHKDDVSVETKRQRWNTLQALMEKIVLEKNQAYVDKVVKVLVEKVEGGKASGNSEHLKLTIFDSDDGSLVGKIVPVHIFEAQTWRLLGRLLS
ncbi:MAG: tRNA (N6-isopentenyl adenosine(37)-C2)-methylthiotransferase MiaB [Patescibacteria group bacterium]|nr:tRNA (N6-isopentenyl adenosine(37)-C2)-methylthiotransferase MiaB [Patescibacteria group bacterium]